MESVTTGRETNEFSVAYGGRRCHMYRCNVRECGMFLVGDSVARSVGTVVSSGLTVVIDRRNRYGPRKTDFTSFFVGRSQLSKTALITSGLAFSLTCSCKMRVSAYRCTLFSDYPIRLLEVADVQCNRLMAKLLWQPWRKSMIYL